MAVCSAAVGGGDGGAVGEDFTADGCDVMVGGVASDLGECGMGEVEFLDVDWLCRCHDLKRSFSCNTK